MTTPNIFLQATKQGLRFPSKKGLMTTEDLWGLTLTTKRSNVASLQNIYASLTKRQSELSGTGDLFSDEGKTQEQKTLDLQVAVITEVVRVRKAENAAKNNALATRREKHALLDAIAERELREAPLEELKKRAAALS